MSVVLVALVGLSAVRGVMGPGATMEPTPTRPPAASFLYPVDRPAPELALVDQDARPFSAAMFDGGETLVFFGYTHCPDVCPATMGILAEAASAFGSGLRVIFVTVDPERDTVDWLEEYVRYLPPGFSALTGTPGQVRVAADAWGVRYARVETGVPGAYSMSHTAEVYLVDAAGRLRASFPFGTQADAILATVRQVARPTPSTTSTPSTAAVPTPVSPTALPAASEPSAVGDLGIEVVSSSVWAGGASPVILALTGPGGRLTDVGVRVSVQLTTNDGRAEGVPVEAVAVRPPGVDAVSYVAFVDIPSPGWWGLAVSAETGGDTLVGSGSLAALDPGTTARLGAPAPAERTPTLDDASGVALRVTTDPLPDLRLSRVSTVDALAAGDPFVLVVDSARFKVTPACGKAIVLAKYLADRWPKIPFIHLEPYRYDVVTDTAVLEGSLAAPTLVPAADAWGIGGAPWGAGSMPWVFVVDGDGIVRAKYQGVIGSDDLDVIVSLFRPQP